MRNRRNYYRLLFVQPDAPTEVIKASYRTLMRKLGQHPDLGGSHETASLLNEAYQTLIDPVSRALYDHWFYRHYPMRIAKVQPDHPVGRGSENLSPEYGFQDRRATVRITQKDQLLFQWPDLGHPQIGSLVDLSPRGLRFITSYRIDPDVHIEIQTPLIKAQAQVIRCRKVSLIRYEVGVVFLEVRFRKTKGTFFSTKA